MQTMGSGRGRPRSLPSDAGVRASGVPHGGGDVYCESYSFSSPSFRTSASREAAVSEPSPLNALGAPVILVKKRPAAPPKPYIPAIGPRLRILLYIVLAGFAFLAATGIYLLVISAMNRVNTNQL